MPVSPYTFSRSGYPPVAKFLYLGAAGSLSAPLVAEVCSLKIEHVSPASLVHQEICRRTPLGQQAVQARQRGAAVSDQNLLAILRKWFWTRKPDAGFLLEGFPATLLHAQVFDEWLEAREETLTGCLWDGVFAVTTVLKHYRTLGLLVDAGGYCRLPA